MNKIELHELRKKIDTNILTVSNGDYNLYSLFMTSRYYVAKIINKHNPYAAKHISNDKMKVFFKEVTDFFNTLNSSSITDIRAYLNNKKQTGINNQVANYLLNEVLS